LTAAGRLALAVILAWLMPWRAALRIREQDTAIRYLIATIAGQCPQVPRERHLRAVK
jgi:hypothetical protein